MSAVAEDHLRSFVERILRLKEEQDTIGADIRDVYAEAKSAGYDKTAMGKLVAEIRAKEKNGARVDELDAILDLYREAYHGRSAVGTSPATHTHAREERAKARTSESMSDLKAFSAEAVSDGVFSREQHAENVALADAVARKYGAGVQ